ncbi:MULTISPECIES: type VI secretion system baseplate subunit TssE [unclassified Duganella]|uniref:type VI secretion system baseplate subunit TssE n=1 Tax=unclassified Duganella TaxID=2636909 RepID=UPI0006F6AFF9|nr:MULTISPECIES: type VI secretion system baseplate subunit TssE [unclassified Duganella]KQV45844.1 type VI secretion protein [Duganella sp. Root336D2]KRC03720.1 type VI secretion protein [Duganella sp. Root198D2]
MGGYRPGLLDRLLGAQPGARFLSPEQVKESVARDLEALLNTRTALPRQLLQAYPECAGSILNFGLADFAGLSHSSSEDRLRICSSIRQAVERHEPRLCNVQVTLAERNGTVNRIDIVIAGMLRVHGANEAVSFSAALQPSSLHYSIKRGAIA